MKTLSKTRTQALRKRTIKDSAYFVCLWILSTGMTAALLGGCTEQLPDSFRYKQQEEAFAGEGTPLALDTKVDMLWIVDNSASMDVAQDRLRKGIASFANKYMKNTWDIRTAVITTDTYMAGAPWQGYLARTIPGTVNASSAYINDRLSTFVNPASNPSLVNLTNGKFTNGVKYNDLVPLWGPSYALLLPGIHDGPITGMCSEYMPYFLNGLTSCRTRDQAGANRGVAGCLNPGGSETAITQCVNTTQNDTVRSGSPIIETRRADGKWEAHFAGQLAGAFMLNATTGASGQGSERGLASVQQFLADNENNESTRFFRKDSLRVLIFISDEDDQSFYVPESPGSSFSPQSYYACDQAGLIANNPTKNISGASGACCANNNCSYGSEGTSCSPKTIDGLTYTLSICPNTSKLAPVSLFKQKFDDFFKVLDKQGEGNPNYFVASIVPLSAKTLQDFQDARNSQDATVNALKTWAVDRGDRYLELGNLVKNGSLALDIGSEDYSSLLDSIGRTIVAKKAVFQLTRETTGTEDMIVTMKRESGATETLKENQFRVNGKELSITDSDLLISMKGLDQIVINYQPKTAW